MDRIKPRNTQREKTDELIKMQSRLKHLENKLKKLLEKEEKEIKGELETIIEISDEIIVSNHIKDKQKNKNKTTINKKYLDKIIRECKESVFVVNEMENITEANKKIEELLGYKKEDFKGRSIGSTFPFANKLEKTLRHSNHFTTHMHLFYGRKKLHLPYIETFMLDKKKNVIHLQVKSTALIDRNNQLIGAILLLRDISERKNLENNIKKKREELAEVLESSTKVEIIESLKESLEESKKYLESIIQSPTDGIVLTDTSGYIKKMNKTFETLLGYQPNELIGTHWAELNPLEDREYPTNYGVKIKGGDCVKELLKKQEDLFEKGEACFEAHIRRKDGIFVPTWCGLYWIYDEKGQRLEGISIVRDLTEKKLAERELVRAHSELQEAKDYLENIFEHSADSIVVLDWADNKTEPIVRRVNKSFEKLFGYKKEEVIGKPLEVLIAPDNPKLKKKLEEFQETLLNKGETSPTELNLIDKFGSNIAIEVSAAFIKDREGNRLGGVSVIRDITERKRGEEEKVKLEGQLRQAQKMEAVGLLAGGVAHDFNNILTAIIGYANLMQMEMKEDELSRIYVQQILSSSERAANLVQSLLAFGRKQIISLKPVKINEIVKKVEKLLLRVIGEDIELKTILASEETTVMVDAAQIEQILMNLATNARDAMPEGGYLTLSTELVEMDEKYTNTHSFGKAGQYVLLSVEDTGIGMDEKTREKIFEPFFTTKEVGKGSGLGLSMVYGAIKQHNGYIDCYSEPDKGTVFKIYLPVMHGRVYPEEISEVAPPPVGGSETVLIAEDNSNVRTLTKGVLEKFGYTVVEAVDGEDAIRVFKENREKINLLLLDVIMPKKNGKEVYEEIRKERPDIKSLFISGYTANIIHKKGLLEESLEFIPKPVSPNKLLRKVREVLDKDRD